MNKRILRKFGFKKDQQGIIKRYIRESGGWEKHLSNTRNFIIESAKLKERNCCIVLGSGWLLDVPIEFLSEQFKKVILVDIIHPVQIIHKLRKFTNVEFIETDISGLIEAFYYFLKDLGKPKSGISFPGTSYDLTMISAIKEADFVISVNILNQLDILICDYILKFDIYSHIEIMNLRRRIQKEHINLLPKGNSCLITDYEELSFDKNMRLIKNKPLVYSNFPIGRNEKKWQWEFDMHQTYNTNAKTIFNVLGMEF